MKRYLQLLLLCCIELWAPAAFAASEPTTVASSAPLAVHELAVDTRAWRVEIVAQDRSRTAAIISTTAGSVVARLQLPFAAQRTGWTATLSWLSEVSGGPLLGLVVTVADEDDKATFSALFRAATQRKMQLDLLWDSARQSASGGAAWRLLDTDADGRLEVVVATEDSRLAACTDRLMLHPVVVGGASGVRPLRRASLVPVDAAVAARDPLPIRDRFALDGAVSWLSQSDASLSSSSPVAALHDDRDDTVWAPSRDNPAGEFAVIKMTEGITLDGMTIGLAAESAEGSLLLHFGDATRRLQLLPGQSVTVRSPTPVASGCTSVEVVSKRGSRPLLVSTIRPVTALDTEPPEAIFDRVLLPILKRSRTSGDRSMVIRWLATAGPALLPHLERAMRDELGDRQSVLVLATLEIAGGDELLAYLAVEGVLEDESIGIWKRANRPLTEAALTVILAQFNDGAPDIRLLPLVARTPLEASVEGFIGLLRSPSPTVRQAAMNALPPNAPALLGAVLEQAVNGSGEERARWLATALKLSRHQRALERGPASKVIIGWIDRLLDPAVAADQRVAVTLVGSLALVERLPTLVELAAHGSNEWVRVSSLEALARWPGSDASQRQTASATLAVALRDASPTVRMSAASLLARESTLTLSLDASLSLLGEESWPETRASLIRILTREAERSSSLPDGLFEWLRSSSERERLAFLSDFRPDVEVADDRWLSLDMATQSEPAARRSLLFTLGRTLTAAQQRLVERMASDRREPDEVRLAATTVLARSSLPDWQSAAAQLLQLENASAAQRAAELLCTWSTEAERPSLADEARYPTPHSLAASTLRLCKGMASDPSTGLPLRAR